MGEWFKDWFASEEYLQVYSHRDNAEAKQLIDFILNEIPVSENVVVLDAACGAGRHSKIFIEHKCKVFGFDLSKTLLKIANQSIDFNNANAHFVCADLRNICFKQKFDIIVNLFTSFGYFDSDADNQSFISSAFDLLNDHGYYIFDYLNPVFVKNNLVQFSQKVIGNKEILEERKIVNGRVEKTISIKNDSLVKIGRASCRERV